MKKVVLAFSSTIFLASLAFGVTPANTVVTITFDGYCDGMSLQIQGTSNTLAAGSATGCNAGFAIGGNGGYFSSQDPYKGAPGTGMAIYSTASSPYPLVYLLNFAKKSWANYYTTDGVTWLENLTGTFSYAKASVRGAGPSSAIPAANGLPAPATTNSVNVSFDGFCDGMTLNYQGKAQVWVAGSTTGCSAGFMVGGSGGIFDAQTPFKSSGIGSVVASTVNAGSALTYLFNFQARTWANYYSPDGGVTWTVLNSGTMTLSAPALGAKGTSSAAIH